MVHIDTLLGHYCHGHHLTQYVVGLRKGRGKLHALDLVNHSLYLLCHHIFSAHDDHFLQPSRNVQAFKLVEISHVSTPKKALGGEAVFVRHIVVATEYGWASDAHLTNRCSPNFSHLCSIRHNLQLKPRDYFHPDCLLLPARLELERNMARGLCHAVSLDHVASKSLDCLLNDLTWQRLASSEDPLKRIERYFGLLFRERQ
mmetsp:Transcript_2562/g.2841  ORF Transcript_2562/g.2841 Transcript_2562/m.2841 type:complete len:201 (+) Transcript_2562:831-1433(+)